MQTPSVGRMVHYKSYGTPKGEFTPECRAAIVTAVREDPAFIDVMVANPTGIFFDRSLVHDEDEKAGGTWHWPEMVD